MNILIYLFQNEILNTICALYKQYEKTVGTNKNQNKNKPVETMCRCYKSPISRAEYTARFAALLVISCQQPDFYHVYNWSTLINSFTIYFNGSVFLYKICQHLWEP